MNDSKAASGEKPEKTLLNAYIYDYLIKNELIKSASAFLSESECPVSNATRQTESPRGRSTKSDEDNETASSLSRLDHGAQLEIPHTNADNIKSEGARPNRHNESSALEEGLARSTEEKSINPAMAAIDLPLPSVPIDAPGGFLYEWWTIFWDIYSARSGKGGSGPASAYIAHTQRIRQEQQRLMSQVPHPGLVGPQGQMVPGNFNAGMMRGPGVVNGMMHAGDAELANMNANQLSEKQRQQAAFQRQAMMNRGKMGFSGQAQMQQAVNPQMGNQPPMGQHDGSDMMSMRSQSPSGAPGNSPSKRQRLSPDGAYAPMPTNGRPSFAPQGAPQNPQQIQQFQQALLNAGINPNCLTQAQMMQFQSQTPQQQAKHLQMYTANLATQQRAMANAAKNQAMSTAGSPMMSQVSQKAGQMGMVPEGYYPGSQQAQSMRGMPGNNHALQDYQMQLMVLEQQNKKRLQMARQEQERLQPLRDNDGASPSATGVDMNKRGTPKMSSQQGPGSPILDHTQTGNGKRNASPSMANFNGQLQMDPQQQAMYYNSMIMGPNGQMMGRGASAPQQFTSQQVQEMLSQRNQQGQRGIWQQQQILQPMNAVRNQAHPQQMLPPHGPLQGQVKPQPGSPNNGQPPTPTQSKQPLKKKELKDKKKWGKRGGAPVTPSATSEPPTPTTPITPQHHASFQGSQTGSQTGAQGNMQNAKGFPAQPPSDAMGTNFGAMDSNGDPTAFLQEFGSAEDGSLLNDFDFDSFLNTDDVNPGFDAASFFAGGSGEVEAGTGS